jgi:hypothetical protein
MWKKFPIFLLTSIFFLVVCGVVPNSPFDENSPNFIPPVIAIDTAASSIKADDTINFDTASLYLTGNFPICRFQVRLDSLGWSSWKPAGVFPIKGLTDGKHMVYINTMYEGGIKTFSDSIVFFVKVEGFRPLFSPMLDTVISMDTGSVVSFSVSAYGATPLVYQWYKGADMLEGKTETKIALSSFSLKDTGAYRCIATNLFGCDTSRVFSLKFRPVKGGIKGFLVSSKNGGKLSGVEVTAAPGTIKCISNSGGLFEITHLSSGIYSIAIAHAGYQDFSMTAIAVNDSTTNDVGVITLVINDSGSTSFKVVYNGNGNTNGSVPFDTNNYKAAASA